MIKKIELKNFQIHKHLLLSFDKNFTIITGPNDAGKSSIIRAIYWCFYNEPNGMWMCRIDKNGKVRTASVKIWFDDDTVILRKKGKGINKYEVNGEPYQNFGYKVPPQVKEAIRIFPLETNKTTFNVNISTQDEHPFLIHESGPVKASVLDILTGNSIVQKAISSFNKESLAISNQLHRLETNIAEDNAQLETIPDIENAQKELDKAVSIQNKIDEDIFPTIAELEQLHLEYDLMKEILKKKEIDISDIEQLHSEINKLEDEVSKLSELRKQYNEYKDKDCEIPDIYKVLCLYERARKVEKEYDELIEMKTSYRFGQDRYNANETVVKDSEVELKNIYKDNPNCPTCGNVWEPLDV